MMERFDAHHVSRRTVLRKGAGLTGAGLVGSATMVGTAAARGGSLVSRVNSDGRYAVFDSSGEYWRQSKNPLDIRTDDDRRFLSEPGPDGSLRCRIEGDQPPGNAGGYVSIGALGDVNGVTIESEAVTENALLWTGFFFDVQGTGGYWKWERLHGNTEQFVSLGDDPECLHAFPAGGELEIGDETELGTLIIPDGTVPDDADEGDYDIVEPIGAAVTPYSASLSDFKVGFLDGDGYQIDLHTDETTQVGLALAVFGLGDDHEIIIHNVTVE